MPIGQHIHVIKPDRAGAMVIIIIIIIKLFLWRQYPRKIRAQWRNKTKGLCILETMFNTTIRQPMDGGAKKLRRIGNFKKIGFQITAKSSYISC